MKRHLFFFLCVLFVFSIYASDNTTVDVPMAQGTCSNPRNEVVPVVTYSEDDNSLSVTFECEESCSIEVRTAEGEVTYSSPISTSGASNVYTLNLESESFYIITISSISETYTGILYTE